MPDLIGQSLGRYHILEQLGEGGMAVVYKALDITLQRHVAVKIILPYRQHTEKFLTRFEREARALAKLSHPNILKIFDYGDHEDLPYLVMEYIPGGTLSKKLTGKPLDWQTSATLLAKVARALESAHLQNIIHRDVKPANILISNEREPLLSDFGIAKIIANDDETVDLTGSGVGIGTPQYMAPEQGLGRSDERSDVYSLGVIFYEMVTGHRPFEADTPMAVMLKKNTEPLPRPILYNKSLPSSVENVLIKSLARDPKHRYADMTAFALALENLAGQSGTPLDETGEESDYLGIANGVSQTVDAPVITGSSKNKFILPGIVLTALAVCFVIGAGVFIIGRNIFSPPDLTTAPAGSPPLDSAADTPGEPFPTEIASQATEAPAEKNIPTDTPVPASPVPQIPAPTANGKWIAFYSNKSGNDNIYIVDTDGNNLTEITTNPAHDRYPSWSPDGRQIVYETNEGGDQELMVIDVESRELRKLTSNDCNDFEPSWSPSGDWIAYYSDCDGEREIYKVRTNGNDRQQLTVSTGAYNWFPSWSPDGNKITFSSNRSGKYYVYVMNADGSGLQQLARGCVSNFSPDGSQIVYGVYCTDTDALWIMNSDGSGQQQITEGVECKNANWSPDGTKIVFGRSKTTKDGPFAVFIMSLDNPDPSNWTQITDYDINGRSPVWQP